MALHPPGDMIFDKHDTSRRYLTLMTAKRWLKQCNGRVLPDEERICKYCHSHNVEDEYHFVMICDLYSIKRRRLLQFLDSSEQPTEETFQSWRDPFMCNTDHIRSYNVKSHWQVQEVNSTPEYISPSLNLPCQFGNLLCCYQLFSFVNTRKSCGFVKAKGFIILFWEWGKLDVL